MLSLNEREFIARAAAEQQRVDGRRPFDPRKLSLRLGPADGTAEVQLGHTRVLAAVSAELGTPFPDRPTEGALNFLVECPPMGHGGWDVGGKPPDEAVEITRLLERTLRDTGAVDTEALCVLAGRSVWTVKVAVHVVDHDGALMDACTAAALAALLTFRHPAVSVGGDTGTEVTIVPATVKEAVKLNIHLQPLALTFAFIAHPDREGEELLLVDPSYKEQATAEAVLTAAVTPTMELCAVHKPGGTALTPSQLARAVRIAAAALPARSEQLNAALGQFESERERRRIRRKRTDHHTASAASAGEIRVVASKAATGDVEMEESSEESSSSGEEEEAEEQREPRGDEQAGGREGAAAAHQPPQKVDKEEEKRRSEAAVDKAAAAPAAPAMEEEEPADLTAAVKPRAPGGKKKKAKR